MGTRQLLVYLFQTYVAEEHRCIPPNKDTWHRVARQPRVKYRDAPTYPCVECGQHWQKLPHGSE
jgi:hypothetical protein